MFDLIASSMGVNVSHQDASGWVNRGPLDDYWYQPRGMQSSTGLPITEDVAMTYNTVYACVAKIAKTMGAITQDVFEHVPGGGKKPLIDHDLQPVLHDVPNDEMDAVSYEESQIANLLLGGMRYSEIVRHNRSKRVKQLWPLNSRAITPTRDKQGKIVYEYRPNGVLETTFPADRVLAIPGLSFNGLIGLTPIGVQRESISLGLTTMKFGAKLFDNGAILKGFLKTPKRLSDNAYKRLKDSFASMYQGWEQAHGTPIFEHDVEYQSMSVNPDDAQFLESRRFQSIEICGMFDVPPHKIGILEHATFSNIEEQQIQWVVDTISPLARRMEAAKNRQLLGDEPNVFVLYNTDSLLRGDTERRHNALAQGRQWGWLSTNDVRRIQNMNPVEGGDDDRLTPLNMRVGNEPRPASNSGVNNNASAASKLLPVVEDAARRIVTKEVKAVENAFKRTCKSGNADGFAAWAADFYDKHERDAITAIEPIALALLGNAGTAIAMRAARKYATDSLAAIIDCVNDEPSRIPQELNAWLHGKPSKIETLAAEWSRYLQ